ncbi:hypothetical protein ACWDRR_15575 [Kitasatospora sp. NPDC003701]
MRAPDISPVPRPAAYLCSPPQNPTAARDREALTRFAARLGLPAPVFYLDRARPSSWGHRARPRFEELVLAVIDGTHRLLLIPGPWVLSSDEYRVRLSIRVLTAAGCTRILMPPRHATPTGWDQPPASGDRPPPVPSR